MSQGHVNYLADALLIHCDSLFTGVTHATKDVSELKTMPMVTKQSADH